MPKGGRMLSTYGQRLANQALTIHESGTDLSNATCFADLEAHGFDMFDVWAYCAQYARDTNCLSYRDAFNRIHKYVFDTLRERKVVKIKEGQ